ncbi:uncharacterized protein BcabD6B2_09770 [Babesia caballi]|uniref:Uncharacterized protein n=1 Tax=Babesia caballi TaxID=5871 RepID=A0AAV4LPL3_BABCB|nr:hypothetical protein, conserved [Babesia caballi]
MQAGALDYGVTLAFYTGTGMAIGICLTHVATIGAFKVFKLSLKAIKRLIQVICQIHRTGKVHGSKAVGEGSAVGIGKRFEILPAAFAGTLRIVETR